MSDRVLVVIANERFREKAAQYVRNAPLETRVEFKAPSRTLKQNALMWQRLHEVADQVVWYGAKLSAEDWKDIFTAKPSKGTGRPWYRRRKLCSPWNENFRYEQGRVYGLARINSGIRCRTRSRFR